MNETKLTRSIRETLNYGTTQLSRDTAARLHQARQKALARQRVSVSGLSLAGIGHFATDSVIEHGRALLAALAVILGVAGSFVWTHFELAAEHEEVDSALLADDLPPAAFLDKGFQTWLERSSQSSQ